MRKLTQDGRRDLQERNACSAAATTTFRPSGAYQQMGANGHQPMGSNGYKPMGQ